MAPRKGRNASAAQIIDFFSTANDQERSIVDYFKTAPVEQASAALVVAQTVVKARSGADKAATLRQPRQPRDVGNATATPQRAARTRSAGGRSRRVVNDTADAPGQTEAAEPAAGEAKPDPNSRRVIGS